MASIICLCCFVNLCDCAVISAVGAGGFHPVPTAIDAVARDSKQNRKSKWDKVVSYEHSLAFIFDQLNC